MSRQMRGKLSCYVLFGFLLGMCAPALATSTVTLNVRDFSGNAASTAVVSVRVDLQNCAQPRVPGSFYPVPRSLSRIPNPYGTVTFGGLVANTLLDCGQGVGLGPLPNSGSYYTFNIQARGTTEIAESFVLPDGIHDLSTLTPVSAVPVVNSPSGDGSYLRLDLGNFGNLTQPLPYLSSAGSNGILNAALASGNDIGAKVNNSFTLPQCASSCTVEIPAGVYSYSTPIVLPTPGANNVTFGLRFDPGAILTYTGIGCAVSFPVYAAGQANTVIHGEGAQLVGTSAASAGICIPFSNHVAIYDLTTTDFTSGSGISCLGCVVAKLYNVNSTGNKVGLLCGDDWNGSVEHASCNHLSVFGGSLANNLEYGFQSESFGGPSTPNQSNMLSGVDFEGNGSATYSSSCAVQLDYDLGTVIESGYFEGSFPYICVGTGGGSNSTSGISIHDNYMTSTPVIANGLIQSRGVEKNISIERNTVYSAGSYNSCFYNVQSGAFGYESSTYFGKNYINGGNPVCFNSSPGVPNPTDGSFWFGVANATNGLNPITAPSGNPTNGGISFPGNITVAGYVFKGAGTTQLAPIGYNGAEPEYSSATNHVGTGCGPNGAIEHGAAGGGFMNLCVSGTWQAH